MKRVEESRLTKKLSVPSLGLTVLGCLLSSPALAYPGEQLLNFSANYILAPLGIIAVVVFLAGSLFRPDLAKHAVYAIVICAVLFCVIRYAPQLMTAVKTS